MQFPGFVAVQLLCSVQSDDAVVVTISSVQLVHLISLKHAAQHAAVALHANDGASCPTVSFEQHIPLVVLPHDAALPSAAAAPVMSSDCTSTVYIACCAACNAGSGDGSHYARGGTQASSNRRPGCDRQSWCHCGQGKTR